MAPIPKDKDAHDDLPEATSHVMNNAHLNPSDVVLEIECKGKKRSVTREARDHMKTAIEINTAQPMLFFRAKAVVKSATEILEEDFIDYLFPQTEEEVRNFNWDGIEPSIPDTYPKGKSPTKEELHASQGSLRELQSQKG
jgi:hypothetical protein